jgi:hypothetical protein
VGNIYATHLCAIAESFVECVKVNATCLVSERLGDRHNLQTPREAFPRVPPEWSKQILAKKCLVYSVSTGE